MRRLLSIEEIARQTALEESLLRFYESEYGAELPAKTLRGDTLLFDSSAVDAFRRIHARHQAGPEPAAVDRSAGERYGRVLAVTSGKGGVGKSTLSLNLAIELQRLGLMSVVLDADMGLANIHLLAGIAPAAGLNEVMTGAVAVADCLAAGPEGIGIVAGGGGLLALADAGPAERRRLIEALGELERLADMIIVDTGAGMGRGVRDFLHAADEILFVLTPDLTSLADAYGLLKGLVQENREIAERPLHVVVNMAETLRTAADAARRFGDCAERFLDCRVHNAGYILKDATVGAALSRRQPYTVFRPEARASKNTRNLAKVLLKQERPELRQSSAFGRYFKMLRTGTAG